VRDGRLPRSRPFGDHAGGAAFASRYFLKDPARSPPFAGRFFGKLRAFAVLWKDVCVDLQGRICLFITKY
jgi:hypothetical protein